MLEQKIEELTAAVKALALALNSNTPAVGETPKLKRGDQKDEDIASPREKSVSGMLQNSNLSVEGPNGQKKSEDTIGISQTSSPESVTYDDVKRATNSVSKISREKAIAGLARFGVASATKLTEAQWPEYVDYMGRVASEEIDPESSYE